MPADTEPRNPLTEKLVALINEREREQARVSRILHDRASQVLSAVGLQLDVLRMDFREQAPGIVQRTAEIQTMLEGVIEELRGLSYELNPSVVERAGLAFALERLVGRFRESAPGSIRLAAERDVRISTHQGTVLYKIAEFALDNAVQHADFRTAEVLFRLARDRAVLEVRDDGAGFAVHETELRSQGGLGLLLMRYYASQNGIRLTIHSGRGKGTIVKATCPVEQAQEAEEP
jgi:two-component system, NarL family, sensor histidine kinase NreB